MASSLRPARDEPAPRWRCSQALGAAFALIALGAGCGAGSERSGPAGYVSSATCAGCHPAEHAAWRASLHALAMQPAEPGRVRASFDGAPRSFSSLGAVRPIERAGVLALGIRAEGGRGSSRTIAPLRYVLGRAQIEQFLAPAAGGRLQALPVGYDTVAGQWFDIFPEAPGPDDWTYWRGPGMTANTQCLPCHTTGYAKGYRPEADSYESRWVELGIGCEACHGPGAAHSARRLHRGAAGGGARYGAVGSRAGAMATCLPCHSRRVEIAAGFVPGKPVYDFFRLELLDTGLYYPDGRLRGEAFEWTSFQMSLMVRRGVVCQDCHDPHRAHLRAEGDALCLRCHEPALATPAHTHHPLGSRGARCVACHMPPAVFMERDVRRDHQLARPDPEGAALVGSPDPCTGCHTRQSPAWAARWARRWYGSSAALARRRRAAEALRAGRAGRVGAVRPLLALLGGEANAVRRASAARLLGRWASRADVATALATAARDGDPLVRAAAVESLGKAPAGALAEKVLLRAARDPVRLVRVEAGFALRRLDLREREPATAAAVRSAFAEWLAAEELLAELPEPNFNRGVFLAARGKVEEAEAAYRVAIQRWPAYLPARQNLAILLAEAGRDAEAEAELEAVLARAPGWPPAAFALGLLHARHERWEQAVRQLETCLEGDPAYPRAVYNLALAYINVGALRRARRMLVRATRDAASRADALRELVRLDMALGDKAGVRRWLPEALRADPALARQPEVRAALDALEGAHARRGR